METVLKAEDLSKSFGDTKAVEGVNLEVFGGEVFGLIGPDGAGKTTTLRMLCGLVRPDSGKVSILNYTLPYQKREAHAAMGYMPQQYSLYGDLSVQENLRFFAGMNGVPRSVMLERESRLLAIARLDRFRDRPARALSGGMYKKLALACALIHQPKLLLLDEPTNGVDPISRRELWAFLYELVDEGVAVVVSTPYMDEAERCQRVGLLLDGRIVAMESPKKMVEDFHETIFEIETEPILESFEGLEGRKGVLQIYLVGRKIHILSDLGEAFGMELKSAIEANGVQVRSMEVVKPSFEDIFLHLTESRTKQEVAA